MNNLGNIKHLFASANCCDGFTSLTDDIISADAARKVYTLQGAGSKSTFLKKIGSAVINDGVDVEYHHCPTNPNALKGIYIPSIKVALVDGAQTTSTIGASVINFDAHIDPDKLYANKEELISYNDMIDRNNAKAFLYLKSAQALYNAYIFATEPSINKHAKSQYENTLYNKISELVSDKKCLGNSRTLFSCAISGEGLADYIHTIIGKTKNIYLIKETPVCTSKVLMDRLKDLFVSRGYNIECYMSPIDPTKIEDIIVPEAGIAFTISNSFRKPKVFPTDIYDFTQCIDQQMLSSIEHEANKDYKLMTSLLEKAFVSLEQVNKNQTNLENYYENVTDISGVNATYINVLEQIFAILEE